MSLRPAAYRPHRRLTGLTGGWPALPAADRPHRRLTGLTGGW